MSKKKSESKKFILKPRQWIYVLRLITALLGTAGWIYFAGTINGAKYEYAIHDALVRFRGPLLPPKDIVVVALDEATYRALELPMDRPVPRMYHAKLLKRLAELGAKRVVFDIVFAGQSSSPEGDAALSEALTELPVVLGVDHGVQENHGMIVHELIKPDPFLADHAAALAAVGMQIDDGVARHFLFNQDENLGDLVYLSEAGAGIYKPSERQQNSPKQGDLINFYGPGKSIRTISLYQVLEEEVPIPEKLIKDKIIYVGLVLRTGLGATQKDNFMTPFGDIFGVEIHATQAANLLDKNWFRRPSTLTENIVGGILVFTLLMLLLRLKPQWAICLLIAVIVSWHIAAYVGILFEFFLVGGSAVTAVMPIAVIISATFWYLRTHKKQQEIEKAFSLYLAPAMVTELKRNPALLKLGGEEIVASAIFTDIAGFTGISEKLGATGVTAMLNSYFTSVGQVILEEEGTLIKFIGDAVFALWGAPLPQSDHAARACRAALKIQKAVDDFNARGEYPALVTRVGVHTGKMVVGNLGSNKRFDFTAIGDAVNLSSRVEGVNKYLGTTVLLTEDAMQEAKSNGGFQTNALEMGSIKVLGREVPISLYRVTEDSLPENTINEWKQALAAFAARKWDEAQMLFEKIMGYEKELKIAAELYLENLEQFRNHAPPDSWKGELSMDHK